MKFQQTPINGLHIIECQPFSDHRGSFSRIFCKQELQEINHHEEVVQINHSITETKGAVRGMHYQVPPHAEVKIVRCIRGAVFDVVVDVRAGSKTFLQWFGSDLTRENNRAIYVPKGFAHGFQVLEAGSELLYFHTGYYNPDHEGGLIFNDPLVGIKWPLEPTDVSSRDKSHKYIEPTFKGISL